MDEALRFARVLVWTTAIAAVLTASLATAETLADPTRPALPGAQTNPADTGTVPQVGVGMVVTAKEGVVALVEGRMLRVGSRTDGGVVVQILPDAVFVRSNEGKVTRLSLYPDVSLRAVTHGLATGNTVQRPDRSKRK